MARNSNRLKRRCRPSCSQKCSRAGVATLEFVLGLPFLMLVMAIIFAVAYTGVNKTKVVFQVRHQVWTMREDNHSHTLQNYKRIKDTKPMQLTAGTSEKDMPGEISGTGATTWKTYSWLGGNKTATSNTVIITGTWDHKEITNFDSAGPHFSVLQRIGGMQGLGPLTVLEKIISFVL